MLTPRKTKADWESVPTSNAVAIQCDFIQRKAKSVLQGRDRLLVVAGPTSVGKSFLLREACGDAEPITCRPENAKQLVKAFEQAGTETPIILEEADNCLRSYPLLNVLKMAADPKPRNRQHNDIFLDAPVFLACNTDLSEPYKTRYPEHWAPLFRRSPPIIIPDDREQLWEYACYLAICKDMLRKTDEGFDIARENVNAALAFFTAHLWRLKVVGPGVLMNVAAAMSKYDDAILQKHALDNMLLPKPLSTRSPPQAPKIFVKAK